MKKKLNWRLGKLPSPDEVRELVRDKIITQDEAREILFSEQEETERDAKSLEAEIKFLRELVERLSKGNQTTIVETIRYIEKPYIKYPWYGPYQIWCSSGTNQYQSLLTSANSSNQAISLNNASTNLQAGLNGGFSSIATF